MHDPACAGDPSSPLRAPQDDAKQHLYHFFYLLRIKLLAQRAHLSLVRIEKNSTLVLGKKRPFSLAERKRLYEIDERIQFSENDTRLPADVLENDWQPHLITLLEKLSA